MCIDRFLGWKLVIIFPKILHPPRSAPALFRPVRRPYFNINSIRPIPYFAYPIWLICSGKQVYYRNFLQRDYAIMYQEKTFNFTGRGSRKKFATKLCLVLTFFMSRLMFWQGTFNIHHILPLFVFIYRPGWKLFALPPWVWKTIFWANAAQKYFDFESMKVFDIFFQILAALDQKKMCKTCR